MSGAKRRRAGRGVNAVGGWQAVCHRKREALISERAGLGKTGPSRTALAYTMHVVWRYRATTVHRRTRGMSMRAPSTALILWVLNAACATSPTAPRRLAGEQP
jgi:hypothetical protein